MFRTLLETITRKLPSQDGFKFYRIRLISEPNDRRPARILRSLFDHTPYATSQELERRPPLPVPGPVRRPVGGPELRGEGILHLRDG